MNYYKQKQFIAQVDKNDKILGKIEKWEAHKKGILHRGFTAILIYKNQYLIQHRKHPVFDKVFDLSFSSHPVCHPELVSGSDSKKQVLNQATVLSDNERIQHDKIGLQAMEDAVYAGLKREWNIEKKDLKSNPRFLDKFYYKAKDTNSIFSEHEIDYIYEVKLNKLPSPNYDFCYGCKLVNKLEINLAPWVNTMIEEKIIK